MYPTKHDQKYIVTAKLKSNRDLHFIHDLYNRIRILVMSNKYTMDELVDILSKTKEDREYVDKEKEINKKRYKQFPHRFEEKFKISMIYYIIETNRYDELYQNRIDKEIDPDKIYHLPPDDIMKILKDLSENYNCSYKAAITKGAPKECNVIPSPLILINKFLPEFQKEHSTLIEFRI